MNANPYSPFSNVDESNDPQQCITQLDAQHATNFVKKRKARCFQLLELPLAHTVLDIGCGTGMDCKSIAAEMNNSGTVIGIDLSRILLHESLSRLGDRSLRATFSQQNVLSLAFKTDSFDCCFAERVFQHVTNAEAGLHEMWRVTKPGGRMVILEPDHETIVIDSPNKSVTRRFIHWRSDKLASGHIAQRLYGWFKRFGCQHVMVEPWVQVFTDYNERKLVAPYLEEMQIAEDEGIISHEESVAWIQALQTAIDNQRFLAMQTSILTVAVK